MSCLILSYLTQLSKVSIKGSFLFPPLYFKFVRQDRLLLLFIFILFKQARTSDVDVVLILYCERTLHNRKINSLIFEDDFDGVVVIICFKLIESFQQNNLPDWNYNIILLKPLAHNLMNFHSYNGHIFVVQIRTFPHAFKQKGSRVDFVTPS